MNRIVLTSMLIAIAAGRVHICTIPTAHAAPTYVVYLAAIMRTSTVMQPSTPTLPPAEPTPIPPTPVPVDPAAKRTEVIVAINAERRNAGCAQVTEDAVLTEGAQAWSDYMEAHHTMSHSVYIDVDWYLHHGYTATDWVSENIAGGPSTGAAAVALWMSDEGHRAVVLQSCENTTGTFHIGVGLNNQAWTLAIGELHT